MLLFGTDGGGEAFAFDRDNEWRVVTLGVIELEVDEVLIEVPTFLAFLEHLFLLSDVR